VEQPAQVLRLRSLSISRDFISSASPAFRLGGADVGVLGNTKRSRYLERPLRQHGPSGCDVEGVWVQPRDLEQVETGPTVPFRSGGEPASSKVPSIPAGGSRLSPQ